MIKDIFKELIIWCFAVLLLMLTLFACGSEESFTPSGTLPKTSAQNWVNESTRISTFSTFFSDIK